MTQLHRLALWSACAWLGAAGASLAGAAESLVPADLRMDDTAARLAYANLLSIERATWPQAATQYERLLRENPALPEALAGLAEMRVREARLEEALNLLRNLRAARPDDQAYLTAYVKVLLWSGRSAEAASLLAASRPMLDQLLRENPDDPEVIRIYLEVVRRRDGPAGVSAEIRRVTAAAPDHPVWLAAAGELEANAGHARVARDLFARALTVSNTPALRLQAGRAAITWGDFHAGERALREAIALNPADHALRDELGRLLASTDRVEEANALYRRWLVDEPGAEAALLGLVRLRLKEKRFGDAVTFAEDAVARLPGNAEAARILAEARRGPVVVTDDARRAALEPIRRDLTGPAGAEATPLPWMERAATAAANGDFAVAVECLRRARQADGNYHPARAQLAEFLAIAGQYDEALREFADLTTEFPGNRGLLLGQARALAWSARYDEALAAYARLGALDPRDPVPVREAARTSGWAKQRDHAAALYATIWKDAPVDRQLAGRLGAVLEGAGSDPVMVKWQAWTRNPGTEEEPFADYDRLEADLAALRAALPADRRTRLDEVRFDLRAEWRLQRSWWLENQAKQLAWERDFPGAEEAYQRLLAMEPGNEEGWFDLSQVQAAQGLGEREHETLARLLALDANHTQAGQALRRREIRSRPVATLEMRDWQERGHGDLANTFRALATATLADTYRDQYEVRAGLLRGEEDPVSHSRFSFHGVALHAGAVWNNWLSGSAGFLHRDFRSGAIGNADSGQAQLWVKHWADAVGLGYEKREEAANGFALVQGTRSDNLWLAGAFTFSRQLTADARITRTTYGDDNHGVALVLSPALAWTDHPRIFKTILMLEYRDTDRAAVFIPGATGLANIVHPYWTPQDYTHAAVTLEWYRDLAKSYFVGSEEHLYDLRATFGTDSESNPALTLEADWRREWRNRWIFRAGLYLNLSREWDAHGMNLSLSRRF